MRFRPSFYLFFRYNSYSLQLEALVILSAWKPSMALRFLRLSALLERLQDPLPCLLRLFRVHIGNVV